MLSSKQYEIAAYVDKKLKENENLQRSFTNFKMQIAENDKENLTYIGDTAFKNGSDVLSALP